MKGKKRLSKESIEHNLCELIKLLKEGEQALMLGVSDAQVW